MNSRTETEPILSTEPSPMKVASPVPVNLRFSPSMVPLEVMATYGSMETSSEEGVRITCAESTGSPSKSSSPDHSRIPAAEDEDTEIGA